MWNFIFASLVLIAAFLSLLIIGALFMWLRGVSAIALPGLGIILATPFLIILLIIIELVTVIAAMFTASLRASALP